MLSMMIESATGCTITVTVTGAEVKPLAELVAVTVKVRVWAAVSSGTEGAVKFWIEPSVAPGVRTTPAGPVQVNVRVPLDGSTAEAFSVTGALLGTVIVVPLSVLAGFVGSGPLADALTAGGVFGGATTIGTVTLAGADCGTWLPWPPTASWNVKLCGPATDGATNVAFALVGLLMFTIGSPGFTICAHWNGPVGGVLAVPSSVTVTPANGGFGLDEYVPKAVEANWPET